MRKLGRMSGWLYRMFRSGDGDHFLAVLIRAHSHEEEMASMALAFRAGLKIGLKYPDIGKELLGQPEWNI